MDLSGSESTPVIDEAGFRLPIGSGYLISDWLMGKPVQGIKFSTLQLFD